ncbi:sporulation protein YjcZ [Paenibacillus sp. FSL H8-0548]|uniref:sporulation protein YjcZ n=1 Tax=Paenibacillus sp. FSL H8-0548 TaxID=1920422 RepID=UPI00117C3174|nr:sporulation protein YjcZ [Paenibacillus sp. FSL H8-0548]
MSYGVAGVGAGNCGPSYPVAGVSNCGTGVGGWGTGIGIILVLFILLVIITRACLF